MTDTSHQIWDDIYDQLCRRLERKKDESLRFAPRGTVVQVLHDGNLQAFFQSLDFEAWLRGRGGGQTRETQGMAITAQLFVARINERQLHDFLAILIFASCSLAAARAFVLKLVQRDDWPISTTPRAGAGPDGNGRHLGALPSKLPQLFDIFENNVDADKFYSKQGCFLPVVLRKGQEVRVKRLRGQRLPYLEEIFIGEGSFGKIFKVRVAAGHFADPDAEFGYNTEPISMARKDYTMADQANARDEYEIMKRILRHSSRGCENIVESLGGISIGNSFSLFMPLAICDLRAYMLSDHDTRPNTKEAKAEVLLCARGLASGLDFLHNEITTPDLEAMVCYHMDLTPSNILVFLEKKRADGRVGLIWKLSDFGMARVKTRHRGQGVERERDFNRLFVRRQVHGPSPSLSGTKNQRGEGTYLAPESIDANPRMRTGSDVWSLGCVLSVVLSYIQGGAKSVSDYQEERLDAGDADGYDRFFIRGYKFSHPRINPAVKTWHKQLVRKAEASSSSSAEGKAFRYLTKSLEESVLLINQADRSDAKQVRDMLATAYRIYIESEDPKSEKPHKANAHALKDYLRARIFEPSRNHHHNIAQEWPLTSQESFKGCAISPDAALVAYWTNNKIFLYTSQSLTVRDSASREGMELAPVAEYLLKDTDCFWKSITLTNEYLIASTTGKSYVYIFDLEAGIAVDATLGHLDRIALPFPEIFRLAISADSQSLACVLRHEDGDRHPGTLLYASVRDLISLARSRYRSSVVSENFPLGGTSRRESSDLPWRTVNIGWPAPDIIQLKVSNEGDVHLVIRPELTAQSREHKIPIMHISLKHSTMATLFIESRGFDSSGTAGFFTTFTPLLDPNRCAVVTREKRIHFQTFKGHAPGPQNQQKDALNCRVLRFLAGESDGGALYALGTTSANHRIKLLRIEAPLAEGAELVVQELAQFPGLSYGDDFVGVVSEERGGRFALVATLVGANGRRLYKAGIPRVG